MRFNFRTSPDEDGADDLPAELAPLGERLAREADRLAERYPASALRQRPRTGAPRSRRRWAWATVAAAVLVAAGIGSTARWIAPRSAAREEQPIAARGAAPLAAAALPAPTTQRPQSMERPAPRFLPASFHDLSAPQQEAVLDLLEEGDQGLTRLSI